jgi:hypothetical protein
MITIIFDRAYQHDLKFKINGQPAIVCQVNDTHVQIDADYTLFNLSYLTIDSLNDYKIVDVLIDGDSLGLNNLLYLSWGELIQGSKIQPCIELNSYLKTWTLPFMSPLASWVGLTATKHFNGLLGLDISEHRQIFWPQSISLSEKWPKIIKDFFKFNTDFGCYDNVHLDHWLHNHNIPWLSYNSGLDCSQKKLMLTEAVRAINQEKFSCIEDKTLGELTMTVIDGEPRNWQLWFIVDPECNNTKSWQQRLTCDPGDIPEIYSFISSLPVTNIFSAWVGYLPAGCCLYPHIDGYSKSRLDADTGLRGLYIKLNESPGHMMKFSGFGLLPDGDAIINNKNFAHAVVNDSNVDRYILNIQFTGEQDQFSHLIQLPTNDSL